MPRNRLVSFLLLVSLTACSSIEDMNLNKLGVHRIDVQQGNAIDQENVAKLKPGLTRSQVRFLLGTPLVIDPFRTDRWDYVYTLYKGGKLAEQKRVTLFFKGDTLDRIEGDVPPVTALAETAPQAAAAASTNAAPAVATEADPAAAPVDAASIDAAPIDAAPRDQAAAPAPQMAAPASAASVAPETSAAAAAAAPTAAAASPAVPAAATAVAAAKAAAEPLTSVVPPLPNPKGAAPYTDPHPPAESSLQADTNVDQVKPDVMPVFPDSDVKAAAGQGVDAPSDAIAGAVLDALKAWAQAWANRDEDAYIAAYTPDFVPSDGGSHADWEKRRRLLLGLAKSIDLEVKSPKLEMTPDGSALVTLDQYYRSDRYRDAVVKQLRLVQQNGKWLIAEERVLSILRPGKK